MLTTIKSLCLAAAVATMPLSASAFAIYTNQAAFESAVQSLSTTPVDTSVDETFTGTSTGSITLSGAGVVNNAVFSMAGQGTTGDQFTTLTFSSALQAFGSFVGSLTATENVSILIDGNLVGTLSGPVSFFGVVASLTDTPFSTLTFDDTFGGATADAAFLIDNARLVEPSDISPIPLPAGGVLLLTALGGIGLMRRRKG